MSSLQSKVYIRNEKRLLGPALPSMPHYQISKHLNKHFWLGLENKHKIIPPRWSGMGIRDTHFLYMRRMCLDI